MTYTYTKDKNRIWLIFNMIRNVAVCVGTVYMTASPKKYRIFLHFGSSMFMPVTFHCRIGYYAVYMHIAWILLHQQNALFFFKLTTVLINQRASPGNVPYNRHKNIHFSYRINAFCLAAKHYYRSWFIYSLNHHPRYASPHSTIAYDQTQFVYTTDTMQHNPSSIS